MLKRLTRKSARDADAVTESSDSGVLLRALRDVEANAATGRLTVLTANAAWAHLYAFEGQLYAVELEGYQAPVDSRIHSGMLIDASQLQTLLAQEPFSSPAHRARMATAREWMSIQDLAAIHHEFALACFGAALQAKHVSSRFSEGLATAEVCALPLPIDVLMDAVAIREARMALDWSNVPSTSRPEDCILSPVGSQLPAECQLPEFMALFGALDGEKSLARAAHDCGYTLAEAVHLVSGLMVRGLLHVVASQEQAVLELLVPESFSRFVGQHSVRTAVIAEESVRSGLTDAESTDVPALAIVENDMDRERTQDVDAALRDALLEELQRARLHVESVRAQLEQLGAVSADA